MVKLERKCGRGAGARGGRPHARRPRPIRQRRRRRRGWLLRRPTSSSWVNLVEGFFAQLTNQAIRRGAFASVPDLIAAIDTYLAATNTNPTPFTWTKTAEQIVEKVQCGRVTLDAITN